MTFDEVYLKELSCFIKDFWSIEPIKIEYLDIEATANCFKIHTNECNYFLKAFQDSYSRRRAINEAKFCGFLSQNSIPVSEIIYTKKSKPYAIHNKRIYQLQVFTEGYTPTQNSLNENLVCQAASMLGEICFTLHKKRLHRDFDKQWLNKFKESQSFEQYEKTLVNLENSQVSNELKSKIKNDLTFRIELTNHMKSLSYYFKNLTYSISHGDFTPSQLICYDDNIVKIVDFSNICQMPIALELIRFYFLASDDCKDIYNFDINRFKKYINSFCEKFPLSENDLKNMPFIYLYYMGRNRFIYRDFLKTNNINDFLISSQRADITRYLFENAETISSQLVDSLKK